jgi:hypothetical protein
MDLGGGGRGGTPGLAPPLVIGIAKADKHHPRGAVEEEGEEQRGEQPEEG